MKAKTYSVTAVECLLGARVPLAELFEQHEGVVIVEV